jgi:uncharacterized membrane protein YphA (DoxX/SURF4 family)
MTTTKRRVLHVGATFLFVVPLLWSALQYFIEAPKMVATMTHLGYPLYFAKILGVAKVLGAVALLVGRPPRLKEWAYAGFTFDLLGASTSHLASGDGVPTALVPASFLILLAISYLTWDRRPSLRRRAVAAPRPSGVDLATRRPLPEREAMSGPRSSVPLSGARRGDPPAPSDRRPLI